MMMLSKARASLRQAARASLRHGKQWFSSLTARNYATAKALFQFSLWLAQSYGGWRGAPLLVYQMGKVGSTSVVRSLKAAGLKQPLYHIHDLTPAPLAYNEQLYQRNFRGDWQRPSHVWTSQYLLKQLAKPASDVRPWKIVTLTRDPVMRNLSAFFQTLELEFDYDLDRCAAPPDGALIAELSEVFLTRWPWHDYPINWFETELKPVFEIDVYASDFPKARGYRRYQSPQAEALVIKLEALDQCSPEAFGEFLQLDRFRLVKANRATDKRYYPIYRQLVNSIWLPDSYLDQMYASKYAGHFYTPAELERFRARWRSPNRGAAARTGAIHHD